MLSFTKCSDGFLITEKQMSFTHTKVMTVTYSLDLKKKRVNNEPWRDTDQMDRDWFMKHYMEKF